MRRKDEIPNEKFPRQGEHNWRMKQRGITLIALVITVIVLLILAGAAVSIGLNGDNMFDNAYDAKKKWNNGALKEEVSFALNLYWNEPTLKEKLEHITGARVENINGLADTCLVKKDGMEITVYANGETLEGNVEIWDGHSSSCPEFKQVDGKWAWYISKPSQLKFLADYVNNGKNLTTEMEQAMTEEGYTDTTIVSMDENTKVHLMNNLDMGAREGEGLTKEARWETEANEAVKWTPIGSGTPTGDMSGANGFPGVFKGNDYTIRGLYVDESKSEQGCAGLFGGTTMAVCDLTISNSYVKGKQIAGGIALLHMGELDNCHIINSIVSANSIAGGIVAASWEKVTNCTNENTQVYSENYAGGIIGEKSSGSSEVNNCSNSGKVYGKNYAGGIIGKSAVNYKMSMTNCLNTGKIQSSTTNGATTGGIAGMGVFEMTNCNNLGEISGKGNVGGIAGLGVFKMTNCNNSGAVNGNDNVGGVIGVIQTNNTISECSNSGEIQGSSNVGGIIGARLYSSSAAQGYTVKIEKCYNNAHINGNCEIGGIVGALGGIPNAQEWQDSVTITKCYNKGTVTGTQQIGEIIGSEDNHLNVLSKLFYLKNSRGLTAVGGEADEPEGRELKGVDDDLSFDAFKTWIINQ